MAKGDTQEQTQTQNSKTDPWGAAVPLLQGMIGKLGGLSTDVTPEQAAASSGLISAAGRVPDMTSDAFDAVKRMFSSDTSGSIGMMGDALKQYQTQLGGTASGAELDPYSTPGFSDALTTMQNDITNKVKGVYAGSGRDPSGAGSFAKTLGRGLTEGMAPVIATQFNKNKENQMGAAGSLYNAGTGTAGAITGQNQIPLMNAAQGMGMLPQLIQSYLAPAQAKAGAAGAAQGLPFENLMKQLQPAIALGGVGNTSSGTAQGTTTQNQSMMSNIMSGLMGTAAMASMFSDEELKEDVERVGMLNDGQSVYSYRYRGDPTTRIGLMAQEVEKYHPEAVGEAAGFKTVDYKRATDRAAEMERAA